jgi:hypothetical protein
VIFKQLGELNDRVIHFIKQGGDYLCITDIFRVKDFRSLNRDTSEDCSSKRHGFARLVDDMRETFLKEKGLE